MASSIDDAPLAPILDQDRVAILRSLDENQGIFLAELIEMYCRSTPSVLTRLLAAIDAYRVSESILLAHKLKGICSNLGVSRLSGFLAKIETSIGTMDPSESEILTKHLLHLQELSIAALLEEAAPPVRPPLGA